MQANRLLPLESQPREGFALRQFCKASAISLACYGVTIAAGYVISFPFALFLLAGLQVTWTPFCLFRAIQLRLRGANRRGAELFEQRDYAFALGGVVSSLALLASVIVLTQVPSRSSSFELCYRT